MDFIRFTGEWFIYLVLIALGGGVLAALTVGVFGSIGLVDLDVPTPVVAAELAGMHLLADLEPRLAHRKGERSCDARADRLLPWWDQLERWRQTFPLGYDDPADGRPFVRFAFCKRDEVIDAAVERLAGLR